MDNYNVLKNRAEIINNTVAFIALRKDLKLTKEATNEYIASLYSSMSLMTDKINDIYLLGKKTIADEYYKYIDELNKKSNDVSLSESSFKSITNIAKDLKLMGEDFDERNIGIKMEDLSDKFSQMINYDLTKSTNIRPILNSRAEDLILSLKDKLREYTLEINKMEELIKYSRNIYESCNFLEFIIKRNSKNKFKGVDFISFLPTQQLNSFIQEEFEEYIRLRGES